MQTLRLRLQPTETVADSLPSKVERRKAPKKPFEDRLFDRFFEIYDNAVSRGGPGSSVVVVLCVVALVFGLLYLYQGISQIKPAERPLHFLVSTTSTNINLCKTLLTSAILNYPVPVLVNWGEQYQEVSELGGPSNIGKISGVLDWLQAVPPEQDQDLVLIVDPVDSWFQLRSDVLVERYHTINDEANKRLSKQLGGAMKAEGIKQTIVFGATKRCNPNYPEDIGCFPFPDSPLPSDLFGRVTDTDVGHSRYSSFRERFLDSGLIMGPVGDLRAFFERAWSKKDEPQRGLGGSDQSIYNTIVGEQEFQREVMKERHRGLIGRTYRRVATLFGKDMTNPVLAHNPNRQRMDHLPGHPCEFGVGLDYFAMIAHQTLHAETDARFITFANLTHFSEDRHRFDCPAKIEDLPADIYDSPPPYDTARAEMRTPGSWERVPLYTNLCTGVRPVIVHHNGGKAMHHKQWTSMWLQHHGEAFLAIHQRRAAAMALDYPGIDQETVAKKMKAGDIDVRRLPSNINVGSAWTAAGDRLKWWDLCMEKGFERELFDLDSLT
ncbi:MAG: hypothetical protein M1828_004964 [Chrysothrix sp. TS-e1954]|nr:MAG: hypothetical protein M1828_004964 [Chrysothrix sp. TS-e1954]